MENSSSPSQSPIKEALSHAAEVGRKERSYLKESMVRRWGELSERGRRVKAGIIETGRKVASALDTVVNIGVGIGASPEVRKTLAEAIGHQVRESRRALSQRLKEIGRNILHKGEGILDNGAAKLRAIGDSVNERVIRPVDEGAREVGQTVVRGAEAGALFMATSGREVGKTAYSGVKAVYEGGRELVEKSKKAIERGREKAEEWGERVRDFFQQQGENLRNKIDRTRREIKALPYEIAALPKIIEGRVEEAALRGLERVLSLLTEKREEAKRVADERRRRAAEIRSGARELKTRS